MHRAYTLEKYLLSEEPNWDSMEARREKEEETSKKEKRRDKCAEEAKQQGEKKWEPK